MFTIQYLKLNGEAGMQAFDSQDRRKLAKHLMHFEQPILEIYEQATVITKAMRTELGQMPRQTMTRAAKEFIQNHV